MEFPSLPRCLAVLACAAIVLPCAAADWRIDPRVEVGGMADDNLRLDEGEEKVEASGAFGNAELEFLSVTPLSEFSFTPRIEATWFPDEDVRDEDYVNGGARLSWIHRGQTVRNNFRFDYDNSTTVTGNRATTGEGDELGNPDDVGDSGALTFQNRVQTFDVRDTLRIEHSERTGMEAGAFFLSRDFDEQEPGEDVSFVAIGGNLGWGWRVQERSLLGIRLRAQHYNPDLSDTNTNDIGIEGEWRYDVSERVEAYARAGVNRTTFNTSQVDEPDDSTEMVGGLGGNWRFRVSSVFLDLTRAVSPNSSGYSVLRDQLQFRLNREFSERASGSLAVRFINDDAPEGFNERRYAIGSVGAEWRVTRVWSLLARYDYSWQDYELTTGEASSNAVRLSVLYQPRRAARDGSRVLD